jgi:hypothetical protein
MKHLRKERKNVSYQSLGLAGMTIHPIVVHCRLVLLVVLVLLRDGFELCGRPPLTHRVLGLRIFDEPIDLPLKLLLLG